MKKKIGKYLILGIIFVVLLGASIYYFNTLSGENNHLDTFNQDKDSQFDNNEKDTDNDDESDNNSSDDSDNILNNNNSNSINQNDKNENSSGNESDNTSSDDNDNILNNNNSNNINQNDKNENSSDNDDESDNSSDDSSINSEINYFKELNVNDFVSLIDNKEDFVLVISQTWCSHCTNYKPKVEDVANNNKVIIYYIEYNMLSENEKNIFNGYVEFLGTPTTVFFKDGTELVDAKIEGDTTSKKIESILKDNGYIN